MASTAGAPGSWVTTWSSQILSMIVRFGRSAAGKVGFSGADLGQQGSSESAVDGRRSKCRWSSGTGYIRRGAVPFGPGYKSSDSHVERGVAASCRSRSAFERTGVATDANHAWAGVLTSSSAWRRAPSTRFPTISVAGRIWVFTGLLVALAALIYDTQLRYCPDPRSVSTCHGR